ncbi:UNC-5 protein [Aphelenchoides avenae]|nr:UNC-5 protein [Aphelenchus avenae]
MFRFDEEFDSEDYASDDGKSRPDAERESALSPIQATTTKPLGTSSWSFYDDYFADYRTLMNDIVLLESPQSSYVVRSRPAILTCKALNAKRLRFKCNSRWLDDTRHEIQHGVDANTQLPYLRATVEITRQEVEANVLDLGDFACQCYASGASEVQAVRTDTALVRVAYIRKHFYQTPESTRVPEGRTVQLPCVPPDADPKADLFWSKDGREINRETDSNLILANDGSLIISATRITDSGNYTCEARNLANRRISDPAEVVVYVDGGWSPWSSWQGSCSVDCSLLKVQLNMVRGDVSAVERVMLKRRRTRSCNNPAPLNGGRACEGTDEEFQECDVPCSIDGAWSRWEPWPSECDAACLRSRIRKCVAPSPRNGGRQCEGPSTDTISCTNATLSLPVPSHCASEARPLLTPWSGTSEAPTSPKSAGFPTIDSGQIYVLASLGCVALLLAVIIGLIAVLFCRRRRFCVGGKDDPMYFPVNNGNVRTVLLTQQQARLGDLPHLEKLARNSPYPQLGTLNPAMVNGLNAYTLRSARSYASGYSTHRRAAGSRVALLPEYSSSNDSSNGGSGSGSTPAKVALLRSDSRISSADENYATLYDYVGEKYPPSIRTYTEDECVEDHDRSATLVAVQVDSDSSKIELRRSGVTLSLGECTFPDGATWLSSVITFGLCEGEPTDTVIARPVVITFQHCASVFPKDNFEFLLLADRGAGFDVVSVVGEENMNTPVYVEVERDRVHLMTDFFGRFLLAGRPRRHNVAAHKRVHLAAFYAISNDYQAADCEKLQEAQIRIYCVPEVATAIENVRKQEEDNRGILLAEASNFLMREQGALCCCIEDISEGCVLPHGNQYMVGVKKLLIHPHSLKIAGGTTDVCGRIVVYQKGNSSEKQVLEFELLRSLLSADTKQQLSICLDPPTDPEQDWRGLARKLGYDRYIQYFATRPGCSPTSLILDLWEASMAGSDRAVLDLLQTLRIMGRPDAVLVLEQYLATSYDLPPRGRHSA